MSHAQHTVHLVIIVNGVPAQVEVPGHDTLLVAADRALRETHNTGRPISDWEIKQDDTVLQFEDKIDKLGLKSGAELFLSLKAGVGGLQ